MWLARAGALSTVVLVGRPRCVALAVLSAEWKLRVPRRRESCRGGTIGRLLLEPSLDLGLSPATYSSDEASPRPGSATGGCRGVSDLPI